MAYSKEKDMYNRQYQKERIKRVVIKYQKDIYENQIEPEIKKSGLSTGAFIKRAIINEIQRMNNNNNNN